MPNYRDSTIRAHLLIRERERERDRKRKKWINLVPTAAARRKKLGQVFSNRHKKNDIDQHFITCISIIFYDNLF